MSRAVGFTLDDALAVIDCARAALLAAATDRVGAPAISREAYRDAHGKGYATETRTSIFERLLADPRRYRGPRRRPRGRLPRTGRGSPLAGSGCRRTAP